MDELMAIPPFQHSHPVTLHFGCGRLKDVPATTAEHGHRVFFCMDVFFATGEHADWLRSALQQCGCELLGQIAIRGEPETADIDEAAENYRSMRCDVIVAVGGGSAIDFAKALAIGLTNAGSVWDYTNAAKPDPKPVANAPVPLIAAPTTSGSGSEMSAIAVIANNSLGLKSTIVSPALYPKAAIVDPELTASAPPQVRMMTAIDALAHGFENYLNVGNLDEVRRMVGLEAVRRIAPYLDDLSADPVPMRVLADVALGSSLAGWANAFGTTGAAHAIAQSFGATFHIGHSMAVALILPEVFDRTWPAIPKVFASAATAFGIATTGSVDDRCRRIVAWWRSQRCLASARQLLRNVKWNQHDIDSLAIRIIDTMQRPLMRHPVRLNQQDIVEIVGAVLDRER